MMKFRRAGRSSAFTLIELLIVVAIIAILAAIAAPNFLEAQTRAKVSRSHADMRSLATAIESYHTDYNYYPLNGVLIGDGGIQNPQNNGSGAPIHKFLTEGVTTPVAYVTRNFSDPFIQVFAGMPETWTPYYPHYFYTNFDWFTKIMEPSPLPVIAVKKSIYGVWVLAGAGPDRDRLDLSKDLYYDPTNGTISDGDIIHSLKIITK
ncbi:MAG: prepilin-type N-terminal cleavage/methylation domain-containing protein [bacterium]